MKIEEKTEEKIPRKKQVSVMDLMAEGLNQMDKVGKKLKPLVGRNIIQSRSAF